MIWHLILLLPILVQASVTFNNCAQCLARPNSRFCKSNSSANGICCSYNSTESQCSSVNPECFGNSMNTRIPTPIQCAQYLNQSNNCTPTALILPNIGYFKTYEIRNNPLLNEPCQYIFQIPEHPRANRLIQFRLYQDSINPSIKVYSWQNFTTYREINHTHRQDGFELISNSTLQILVIITANSTQEFVGLQISLMLNQTLLSDGANRQQQAPIPFQTIMIAVSIGGTLMLMCLAGIVYLFYKQLKYQQISVHEEPNQNDNIVNEKPPIFNKQVKIIPEQNVEIMIEENATNKTESDIDLSGILIIQDKKPNCDIETSLKDSRRSNRQKSKDMQRKEETTNQEGDSSPESPERTMYTMQTLDNASFTQSFLTPFTHQINGDCSPQENIIHRGMFYQKEDNDNIVISDQEQVAQEEEEAKEL